LFHPLAALGHEVRVPLAGQERWDHKKETNAMPSSPLRTPLYDWHVAHGARMVDFAGWEMPIQYTSITEEHQTARSAAGLFDISHMGRLLIDGPDALDLIQHIDTNDAATMKLGQARYGLVCNERGGIRDDVLVYRFSDYWLMVVNASNREKILGWIEEHKGARQLRIKDATMALGMVAVQGPRALDIVVASSQSAGQPLFENVRALKYYHAVSSPASEGPTVVSRTGYTGEDGIEVILPAARLRELCSALETSANRLNIPLAPCGLGARDTLRLEAAMPLYGHELGEDIDPLQAGLGWAVKLDKGDFIGRNALLQLRENPRRRRRVGLEIEGKRIAREGALVSRDGREAGRITSGTYTPTLAKALAMAYVDPELTPVGTVCAVDVRGKSVPAQVVSLPFYKRPH
jgi:aminomethyltransferase